MYVTFYIGWLYVLLRTVINNHGGGGERKEYYA